MAKDRCAARHLACEQALCLGKNSEEREGEGGKGPSSSVFKNYHRCLFTDPKL